MNGLDRFIPNGPDFSSLVTLANPIQWVLGLLFALAVLGGIGATVFGLVKAAFGLFGSRDANQFAEGKDIMLKGIAIFVLAGFVLIMVINWIADEGENLSAVTQYVSLMA